MSQGILFTKNIVLIGFMGTGKSSVGRLLAQELNRELVDVDAVIEEREKRKISEIFEKKGESYFRRLEKETIAAFADRENLVVTTGGGAVLDPLNMRTLKKNGVLVALLATPETVYERTRHTRHRPLLKVPDVLSEIKRLMALREPHYHEADFEIQTDGKTSAQVAGMILEKIGSLS